MVHHYGEIHFKVDISENNFTIILLNHVTGAEIIVSGPLEGVYEAKERRLDREGAEMLGGEIAHVLRKVLI